MDGIEELADELHDLARQLRDQLLRHASQGAWAAPGGPSERIERAADDADPPGAEEPAMAEATAGEPAAAVPEPAALGGAAGFAGAEGAAGGAGAEGAAGFAGAELPPSASPGHAARPSAPGPALIAIGRKPLQQIREELGECTRCKLHTTRRSIVFGVGTSDTPLMFVGEAPGEQEDRRGEPFVGPAGQLLDKMIEAMGWTRESVYIANTTKCRPPGNRNPQPDELSQCMPFLHQQIASIAPRIIIALGRPASNQLLERDVPISALRGKFHDYPKSADRHSLKIMPTFHPAYLLRDPDKKRLAWADLKLVIAELERLGIAPPKPHA
ncbi:MAG TPA: uracil-DNA glycosylase [Kofleriaceae bacterium]|nr:uracil-DNA glycosylase [Kofleriaceae bacterium]